MLIESHSASFKVVQFCYNFTIIGCLLTAMFIFHYAHTLILFLSPKNMKLWETFWLMLGSPP